MKTFKTAEEILFEHVGLSIASVRYPKIKEAMKVYAEQAIDEFAKRLEKDGYIDSDYWSEGMIDKFKQQLK